VRAYRITVRTKEGFKTFRTRDVGSRGQVERPAGRRETGSWDTQAWLVSKADAHVEGGQLVPDTAEACELLDRLGSAPVNVKGDIFEAKDRPNVPERDKRTPAQRRARRTNIKKVQAARRATSA
jgi:hypothetical protein